MRYLAPTILYAVAIIGASSIPDLSGPKLPVIPFDKIAHLLEYAGLAILINRSGSYYWRYLSERSRYLLTWFIAAAFGAADELYQSTVPGRSPDPADFIADICGAGLAILFVIWWRRRKCLHP